MKAYFINQTGESNKFWTIEQVQNSYTVQWGKIGTEGRTNSKEFADEDECKSEIAKLVKEKLSKGYSIVDSLEKIKDKPKQEYKNIDEEVFWEIIAILPAAIYKKLISTLHFFVSILLHKSCSC